MPSGTFFDYFKALPTADDLARWEEEHARMGLTIKELTEKQEQLGQLIKVAAAIHGGREATKRGIGNANVGKARLSGKGTWMSTILEIASQHPDGIAYEKVREEMPEPFASKLAKDPNAKSFYGATAKLEDAKKLVRYRGHLFTPEGYERHQARVRSGEIEDVQGHDYKGSPLADAAMAYLADHPRAKAKDVKEHLCEFPEFVKGLKRNSSAIYNLLKKLRDREDIVQHDDGSYSLPNENEAPNGSNVGASEAGEVGASSNDTSSLFRVVK
ncbi:hypothetical protein WAB17_08995 [Parerythrobacter aurantius]|uniref:hypothetical protein n=1 Tax=Parerythrobacter aurantius TaxID=3127706 RepID=UPI0032540B58